MKLIVASMSVRAVQRALPAPVGGARHRTNQRHALLVDLVGEADGRAFLGGGEAAPLPGLSLETFDEVAGALSAFAAILPLTIELDDTLLPTLEQRSRRVCHPRRAPPSRRRCSISRRRRSNVRSGSCYAKRRPMRFRSPPWSMPRLRPWTRAWMRSRPRVIAHGEVQSHGADARTCIAARSRGPRRSEPVLRLDANRCEFALIRAEPRIAALRPDLVEEPVDVDLASWLVDGAATLPPLPYAVDESLALDATRASSLSRRQHRARFLPAIAAGRVGAVVLKPARDGIFGALALGHCAAQLGVPVIVSHFWDGPRAHLAACHLALALSTERTPAQGLASFAADDDALRALLRGGVLRVPHASGLGVS